MASTPEWSSLRIGCLGSGSGDWAGGGSLNRRIGALRIRLAVPSYTANFNWLQGRPMLRSTLREPPQPQTSRADSTLRGFGINCPVLVCPQARPAAPRRRTPHSRRTDGRAHCWREHLCIAKPIRRSSTGRQRSGQTEERRLVGGEVHQCLGPVATMWMVMIVRSGNPSAFAAVARPGLVSLCA